jgi:hypothetical protein
MGKFQTQKLIRPIVLKDAFTYEKPLLFHDFSKFRVRLARLASPLPQILKNDQKIQKFTVFLRFFQKYWSK